MMKALFSSRELFGIKTTLQQPTFIKQKQGRNRSLHLSSQATSSLFLLLSFFNHEDLCCSFLVRRSGHDRFHAPLDATSVQDVAVLVGSGMCLALSSLSLLAPFSTSAMSLVSLSLSLSFGSLV